METYWSNNFFSKNNINATEKSGLIQNLMNFIFNMKWNKKTSLNAFMITLSHSSEFHGCINNWCEIYAYLSQYQASHFLVSCSLCYFLFREQQQVIPADDSTGHKEGPSPMRAGRYQGHSTLTGRERCQKSTLIREQNGGPPRRKWDWWVIRWIEYLETLDKYLIDILECLGKRLQ